MNFQEFLSPTISLPMHLNISSGVEEGKPMELSPNCRLKVAQHQFAVGGLAPYGSSCMGSNPLLSMHFISKTYYSQLTT